jgi:hypothetical protein
LGGNIDEWSKDCTDLDSPKHVRRRTHLSYGLVSDVLGFRSSPPKANAVELDLD